MARSLGRRYLTVILVIVVIISIHYSGLLGPLEKIWQKLIIAVSHPVYTFTANVKAWSGFRDKAELEKQVRLLREQLKDNQQLLARFSVLEKENRDLIQALNWKEQGEHNYLIGKIVGHPLNLPRTYLIINRGYHDGIINGMPVVIKENILIGKIVKVDNQNAFVQLLIDSESLISVKLAQGQEPIGIVSGELELSLKLELIPAHVIINTDDIVVTSGLDPLIPQDLIVGSIGSPIKETDDFFQSATVETAYDINQLNIVSVILNE